VLPQDGDEDENGGDEDNSQCDLRHRSTGERLDFAYRALAIGLLMPAGESGKEQETDEGKDDGDNAVKQLVSM
jgi:hypothetical protein